MREITKLHLQSDDQVRTLIESGGTVAQWKLSCQAIQSPMLPNLEILPDQMLRSSCPRHAYIVRRAAEIRGELLVQRSYVMSKFTTYLVPSCAIVWVGALARISNSHHRRWRFVVLSLSQYPGVPNVVERDQPSVTGVEGSSSPVDSLPGINQSPRNAAMLSVIITTPAALLMTDNRG